LIDTHCHIYLPQFKNDLTDVLGRASESGVTDILMPAIDFTSLEQMEQLSYPSLRFHKMAGVHPCEISNSRCNLEASLLAECAGGDIVAVGETGLDYYWSREFVEEQKLSLRLHCKVAKTLGKPIVLHNRDATEDLLDIIEDEQDGRLSGVWHCFNGSTKEGERAIDLNLYLGIGGVLTFKNAGVDKSVKKLPPDRMILETDAPYLTPAPYRGKRNEPAYVKLVAEKLASLFEISLEETDRITTGNARKLFPMINT
jgi:TatD DNase family protein